MRPNPKLMRFIPLALAPILVACDLLDPDTACLPAPMPAVVVEVEDVRTGAAIEGALAVARDGAFADSARTNQGGRARLAFQRAATYDVTVEKDGFGLERRSNVSVDLNECDQPDTAELRFALEPV